jgi:hypothetical protein
MEKSSQIAWKIVPLRHFFPLKVVPLIEVLLYFQLGGARPKGFRGPTSSTGLPGPLQQPVLGQSAHELV